MSSAKPLVRKNVGEDKQYNTYFVHMRGICPIQLLRFFFSLQPVNLKSTTDRCLTNPVSIKLAVTRCTLAHTAQSSLSSARSRGIYFPFAQRPAAAHPRAGSASMFNCSPGCSRSPHLLHLRLLLLRPTTPLPPPSNTWP
jgi:hypothetical protein